MEARILVVDDEKEIADIVELYLQNENFTVYKCYTAQEAVAHIRGTELDLAILDVMLPGTDGFALCSMIREQHNYPVIMLTAKEEEISKITGLTLGADDYITKPFRPLELMARVKAQLRRYTKYNVPPQNKTEDILEVSGLMMNQTTHECMLHDRPLNLTPTEFAILWILCRDRGQVISPERLFMEVWKDQYYSKDNNTIMVHIRHLREKMGESAEHPKYIKTVWGVGYKIEK